MGRRRGGGGRSGGGLFGGGSKKRGGGGGLFGTKTKAPTATRTPPRSRNVPARRPPAQKNAPAQQQQQQQGGMFGGGGGIMSGIAQGMVFGAGSAIGHRVVGGAVDAMSGGNDDESGESQTQQVANNNGQQGPCFDPQQQLYSCLNTNNGDAQACQWFFDSLKTCQENVKYSSQSQ